MPIIMHVLPYIRALKELIIKRLLLINAKSGRNKEREINLLLPFLYKTKMNISAKGN